MTRSAASRPKLVIAGPGAGKTTELVHQIRKLLPTLQPNRVLGAITYTNAASNSIRRVLAQTTRVPPNVFIGTNHAFLSQFILAPYASIFGLAPADFGYIGANLDQLAEDQLNSRGRHAPTPQERAIVRNAIARRLLMSGRIPFDRLVGIAHELIQDRRVRALLCCRLQYLLLDEFQDVDNRQYQIFERVRTGGKTEIYAVGDPEQYISGYTYAVRGVKQPAFSEIPLHKLAKIADVSHEARNRRSCSAIVRFTNQLRPDLEQCELHADGPQSGVFFMTKTDLHDIIASFRERIPAKDRKGQEPTVFYLSRDGDTFSACTSTFSLMPISNRRSVLSQIIGDAIAALCEHAGMTQEQIRSDFDLDPVGIRKLGIRLLIAIKEGRVSTGDSALVFIRDNLGLPACAGGDSRLDDRIAPLREFLLGPTATSVHYYSTIHKAKGLEADAVLVVAESTYQLEKWLATDPQERATVAQDMSRIGYVGFTRARDVLCIACLQKASDKALAKLESMGVHFYPAQPELQLPLFDPELR